MLFYHSGHAEAEGVAVLVARGIFVECCFIILVMLKLKELLYWWLGGYLWSVFLSFWSC